MMTRRFVRTVALSVALAVTGTPLLTTLAMPTAAEAGSDVRTFGDYPLKLVGVLPEPGERNRAGSIAAVDAAARRMYYVYTDADNIDHVTTYDLRPRIPQPIGTGKLVPVVSVLAASPYAVGLDTKRRQLVFITGNLDAGATTLTIGNPSLTVYSDVSHSVAAKWDLATTVPGFFPFGITYAAADDRIYLVGEFSGSQYGAASTFTFGSKAAGAVTAVVALDPATGKLLWTRPVTECQQALFTLTIGGLIARSSAQNALYFACVTGGTANGKTYPGEAGLVRLHIDPKASDSVAAARQPVDFFPISGNYFNGAASGIAAFDHHTDRFYLQSLAPQTPGAWVFDGLLSAWIGRVSATSLSDKYVGLNEGLGHVYIGMYGGSTPPKPTDGIITSDVHQTPVPAGELQPIVSSSFIAADAGSRRVFVRPWDAPSTHAPHWIFEDTMPVSNGLTKVDYDSLTSDIADTPSADVVYQGGASGYGAQTIQVGGTGGLFSGVGTNPSNVPPGTRAAMGARLGSAILSGSNTGGGAGASTQSLLVDLNTLQYYEAQNGGQKWPYRVTSCLDTVGKEDSDEYRDNSQTSSGTDAYSKAICDFTKRTVSGTARMGASGAGNAYVNHSTYDTNAIRTTKDGVVVTTTATATGITVPVAGGFVLHIARVTATAKSVAHGQPGTAASTWSRDIVGVRVTDTNDSPIFSSPGCTTSVTLGRNREVQDTCSQLGDTLSHVAPTKLHVAFPMADVIATPKGAFAAVQQTDAAYFQERTINDQGVIYRGDSIGPRPSPAMVVEAYNDSTEHSRTVQVLAAIQTTSLFTVAKAYDYGCDCPPPQGPPPPAAAIVPPAIQPGTSGNTGTTTTNQPPTVGGTQPVAADLRGFLFLRRGIRDMALIVLLSGLMFGGLASAARRRRLVDVLVTVPRKEAV